MGINEYDKVPPSVESFIVFDRYTEIPAINYDNYGEGLCRRRIRLENISDSVSIGELEDDFHHFRVEIHHKGNRVNHIQGTTFRAPWSTCSEVNKPLQEIIGLQLSKDSTSIGAYGSPTENCTHLFDLTGLLVSHILGEERNKQYDLAITDPVNGFQKLFLWKDGIAVFKWEVQDSVIIAPKTLEGVSLQGKFISWAKDNFDEAIVEGAIALRRMIHISMGRGTNLDQVELGTEHVDGPKGRCYTYSENVLFRAKREKKSVRDFSSPDHAALLLSDMDLRKDQTIE